MADEKQEPKPPKRKWYRKLAAAGQTVFAAAVSMATGIGNTER